MTRGRLIFAFSAQLHRLDLRATAETDPDGDRPFEGGFDPDFKESVVVDHDGDGIGERVRHEHLPVRVPCQIEPEAFDALRMSPAGNAPRSEVMLVFHFRDLERLGLVAAETGDAAIRPGDRLGAIYDQSGRLVQRIPTPPGLYVVEAKPGGFGLGLARPQRNLLFVTLRDRELAAPRVV